MPKREEVKKEILASPWYKQKCKLSETNQKLAAEANLPINVYMFHQSVGKTHKQIMEMKPHGE